MTTSMLSWAFLFKDKTMILVASNDDFDGQCVR